MNIEKIILSNLIKNDQFRRKSIAFLKSEYFSNPSEKKIFESVSEFFESYGTAPTQSAIEIAIDGLSIRQEEVTECKKDLHEVYAYPGGEHEDWLLDETEKFCKDRAVYIAILESVEILDKKSKSNKSPNIIPELLQQALSISFDTQVGHEYFDDASNRFDLYSVPQHKISFDLDMMNDITEGGLSRKTLNIVLACCVHPDTKVRIRFKKSKPTPPGAEII